MEYGTVSEVENRVDVAVTGVVSGAATEITFSALGNLRCLVTKVIFEDTEIMLLG